jgi:hypothetical protein
MGGRKATILLGAAGVMAVVVLVWSIARSLDLVGDTPFFLGSIAIILAIFAGVLMLKDLVLWPLKALGARLDSLRDWLVGVFTRPQRPQATPPPKAADVARPRREH